jgi:sugar phosphate isomerase/epimerase
MFNPLRAGIHSKSMDYKGSQAFFKLSLAQWSLHRMIQKNGMDPFLFAMKAKEMGFEGIEYVNALYFKYLEKFSSKSKGMDAFIHEALKRSNEYNINNVLIMIDGEGNLAVEDDKKRKEAIDNHYMWIDAAAALGCQSVRVNLRGSDDPEKWINISSDSLAELSEYAKKQNINVLVENHGGLSSKANLLVKAIEKTGMDNCGTLPDFGNFCITKDRSRPKGDNCNEEYDRYLGVTEMMPHAKAVSAKSHDFDENGNEKYTDYKRILKIVKDSGYEGYIGVEYEGDNLGEEEGIIATRDLLIRLAAEI